MRKAIKRIILDTPLYDAVLAFRARRAFAEWDRAGRPAPPPPAVKRETVREYGDRFGLKLFVETGTLHGDMIYAVRRRFARIYSVELSPALARAAQARFRNQAHVTVLEGDSTSLLPEIIPQLGAPALFWLDAHHSAGETARGTLETPIVDELRLILERQPAKNVVLIDDARCFGFGDYPPLMTVRRSAAEHGYSFSVENDIIRLVPATA